MVAALRFVRFRHWAGEGFDSIVLATKSLYVVDGVSKWHIEDDKADLGNGYLWETFSRELDRARENGLTVLVWHILSEWNTVATAADKKAAADRHAPKQWAEVMGFR
jgi:ribonuclease HI